MTLPLLKRAILWSCLGAAAVGSGALAQSRGPGGGPPPGGAGAGAPLGGTPGAPPSPSNPRTGVGTTGSGGMTRQHFGPVGRWWDDKSVARSIGLRKDQQTEMDTIFNANKPAIVESYNTFLKQQAKLDALNRDPKADKATVFAAIDAVSQSHATLQKAASAMYLQIRQHLDADQLAKLEKLP